MGEVIGACFRAWDELERARNERRRLAVTLDGEKHFRSFVRRAFIVPNMHARRWEWCRRSGEVCLRIAEDNPPQAPAFHMCWQLLKRPHRNSLSSLEVHEPPNQ